MFCILNWPYFMLANFVQCRKSDNLIVLCHRDVLLSFFVLIFLIIAIFRHLILTPTVMVKHHRSHLLACTHSLSRCRLVCVNGSRILNNQRRLFLLTLHLSAGNVHPNPDSALLLHHTGLSICAQRY